MKPDNASENAEITLVSKKNHNTYYLFSHKIVVCDNENDKSIELPDENGIVCFYDMYYSQGELCVICIAEGSYDLAYILNEDELILEKRKLHKQVQPFLRRNQSQKKRFCTICTEAHSFFRATALPSYRE